MITVLILFFIQFPLTILQISFDPLAEERTAQSVTHCPT
jgi:hypothetical protein